MLRSHKAWLIILALVLLIRFPAKFLFEPSTYLMDFEVFRTAALRVIESSASAIYDPAKSEQMVFKYAPSWALMMAPLGLASVHLGAVIWSILSVGWLVLTCRLCVLLSRSLGLKSHASLAAACVVLLVRPITSEFLQGQSDVLWGLLVVSAVFFSIRARLWLAAVFLALAISLKLPALLFLAYFAIRRNWSLAGRTTACFLGMNLLAGVLLLPQHPVRLLVSWLKTLLASAPYHAFEIGSQSLLALAGRLLRNDGYGFNIAVFPDIAVARVAAAICALLFFLIFLPAPASLPQKNRTILDCALLNVFMVLFSPTCWIATYSALIFPTYLALAFFCRAPRVTFRSVQLSLSLVAMVIASGLTHRNLWRWLGIYAIKGESYTYLVVMILPLFGLFLAWHLWTRKRAISQTASS